MTYVQPISINLSNGKRFTIEYNNENADIGEVREFAAGTILTTDNRYWTGDEVIGRDIDENEVESFLNDIVKNGGVVLPITAYVHSGITVWHGEFNHKPTDKWDSGIIGWSYMTAERIQHEYKAVNNETRQRAKELLDNELKEIDRLMRGEVYLGCLRDSNKDIEDITGGYWGFETLEELAGIILETLEVSEGEYNEIMTKIKNNEVEPLY